MMHPEEALRDLIAALAAVERQGSRQARIGAARQEVASRCLAAMGAEQRGQLSLESVIRRAIDAPARAVRRICAVLLVQALAVPGVAPPAAARDVCTLTEDSLRDVLLRCDYPFSGATAEKLAVLQGLHRNISELLQPLEPTFPNWQGLYAG